MRISKVFHIADCAKWFCSGKEHSIIMDSKSVREIVIDVLREMYAEAEPPLDFDEVVDNPDSFGSNWYKQHFLPQERQKEILDKHLAQHELTSGERTTVLMECGLHLAPTTKRNVEE